MSEIDRVQADVPAGHVLMPLDPSSEVLSSACEATLGEHGEEYRIRSEEDAREVYEWFVEQVTGRSMSSLRTAARAPADVPRREDGPVVADDPLDVRQATSLFGGEGGGLPFWQRLAASRVLHVRTLDTVVRWSAGARAGTVSPTEVIDTFEPEVVASLLDGEAGCSRRNASYGTDPLVRDRMVTLGVGAGDVADRTGVARDVVEALLDDRARDAAMSDVTPVCRCLGLDPWLIGAAPQDRVPNVDLAAVGGATAADRLDRVGEEWEAALTYKLGTWMFKAGSPTPSDARLRLDHGRPAFERTVEWACECGVISVDTARDLVRGVVIGQDGRGAR